MAVCQILVFWPHSIPSITVIKFRPLMFANLPQFVDSPKLLGMMGRCSKALAGGWEFHIRDVSFERCVCWMNAYNRYSYSTLHSTAVCYVYILVYTCSLIYTCTYAQLPFWRHLVPLLAHNHVFLYQILLSVLNYTVEWQAISSNLQLRWIYVSVSEMGAPKCVAFHRKVYS